MRLRTGLFPWLVRTFSPGLPTTGTDSLYLFDSRLLVLHGFDVLRQSAEEKMVNSATVNSDMLLYRVYSH